MKSAPAFSLKNQDSKMVSLSDYAGQWLLLYFYPKDDTPGCTKEACNFRDWKEYLAEKGLEVVGISKDSPVSHSKFAKKHNLNFTLLSDPDAVAIKAYEAYGEKKMFGKTYLGIKRNSYLINPKGQIVKSYLNVNPAKHISEITKDFENFIKN